MMPQFEAAHCRFSRENFALGVTLLSIGLFKKVVLADGIAPYVNDVFNIAAHGEKTTLLLSWMAAAGYTLQIYFDFSGYSDMALGLAGFFGVRLPQNFNSPLKASSIADFWARWHMTLTRFLTSYIYNPLALSLTRRHLAKGGNPTKGGLTFIRLVAFPTMVTMAISGLWHGAGYTFLLWGVLHGVYLLCNQAWRRFGGKKWAAVRDTHARLWGRISIGLTLLCVMVAMVLFRSPTVEVSANILRGMLGANGVALPEGLMSRLGSAGTFLAHVGISASSMALPAFLSFAAWITALGAIALSFPNALQLTYRFQPAIGVGRPPGQEPAALSWSPSPAWAFAMGAICFFAVLKLGGRSEFLYWQF
jgi:D-alanyl-lipoteichoic acid acyltransferase DltB (MBOAT superfamily)